MGKFPRELTYLMVMTLELGTVIAFPVSLSNSVKISSSLMSGTYLLTSSSNVKRPCSTSCRTEMDVNSFVQDAIHMIESSSTSSDESRARLPNLLAYLKLPMRICQHLRIIYTDTRLYGSTRSIGSYHDSKWYLLCLAGSLHSFFHGRHVAQLQDNGRL